MSRFKLNQNKVFLNNSSFLKPKQPIEDYIIDHNLNSFCLESPTLSQNVSKISSSDLYSNALKYKTQINKELVLSKQKALKRAEKELPSDLSREGLGMLQIPLNSSEKNPIINPSEEVSFLRFDEIEKHNLGVISNGQRTLSLPKLHQRYQILKSSYEGRSNEDPPRAATRISMEDPTIDGRWKMDPTVEGGRSKLGTGVPKKNLTIGVTNLPLKSEGGSKLGTTSNNKMIFDMEVTYNKEIYQGLSKKMQQDRVQSFDKLQSQISESKRVLIRMPPVRSYPMVKLNRVTLKTNKELDDLDSKEQNTTKSDINAVNNGAEEGGKIQKYRIYWCLNEIYTWKPEVRESASFILDGHQGILYGGLGTRVLDDVVAIDFDCNEWRKINDCGEKYTMGKYGHSAVKYKRKMYVFGGGTSFQSQMRQKECLSEVRTLNLDDYSWSWVKCSGDLIVPRRNHTAETVGKHMIVHGGLNYKNMVLNDVWLFDFAHHKWSQANLKNPAQALAYHSSCSVYYLQRTRLEAYKGIDRKIAENNGDLIKYEGLYFFGGKNAKSDAVNSLYILEIHKSPMIWFEPETLGKPPVPRCGNTLNFCPGFGLLVIIGGKDDKCLGRPFCNDICVLNLSNMNWLKLRIFGLTMVPARAFHCSAIINSKLYIFGGYNQKGYVNNELNVVEFDPKVIRDVLNAEKEKRLLKKLQERILQEKMQRHKKKRQKNLAPINPNTLREEMLQEPTQDTESDEMGGSFDEMSPEINPNKQRKGAALLKQSLQMLLQEKNENVKENKWKNILDQYNHKNFVSYVPLPQPKEGKRLSGARTYARLEGDKMKRSSTLDYPLEIQSETREIDLEEFVKRTRSERNIKVSDTLRIIDKVE